MSTKKPKLMPINIDCTQINYDENVESSIKLDNDTMLFYLLVAIIHDYLHDVSPNTAVGKDRLIKVIRSLADQTDNPVIKLKIFGGSGKGDETTKGTTQPDNTYTQPLIGSPNIYVETGEERRTIQGTDLNEAIIDEEKEDKPEESGTILPNLTTSRIPSRDKDKQLLLTLDEELCRIILGVFGYVQMKITDLSIAVNTVSIVNFLWDEIDAAFDYYIFEVLSIYQTADDIEKDGIIIDLIIVKCLQMYFELLKTIPLPNENITLPNENITLPINYFACDKTLFFMRYVCLYIHSVETLNTVSNNPPTEILLFEHLRTCLKGNIIICKNKKFIINTIFDCNKFTDVMAKVIFEYIYPSSPPSPVPFNDPQPYITGGYTKKQIGGEGKYDALFYFIQNLSVDESKERIDIMRFIMNGNILFQEDELLEKIQRYFESIQTLLPIDDRELETLITNLRNRLNVSPRNANTFIYNLVRILKDFFYNCSNINFDVELRNKLKEKRALKKIEAKQEKDQRKEQSAQAIAAYPGEPEDIKAAWKISQIYARTGLEGLGLVTRVQNGQIMDGNYSPIALTANPFLKLETQILRKLANYSNPPDPPQLFGKLNGSTIDDKLEDGIIKIFTGEKNQQNATYNKDRFFYVDENTRINDNNSNIKKYYDHWYKTDWRNNNSSKLEKFFVDNALNQTDLNICHPLPPVLCNIPTFIDGWNTSGCVATNNGICKNNAIKSEVPNEGQGFYFKIENNDKSIYYKENVRDFQPVTGNFKLELTTSLNVNGELFRLDIENANITDTTALSAKYVLRNQINNLNNYFTTYFNKPNLNELITPSGDLWETFRTDTVNPMLAFMQYGGRKAIADINIEMSCLYAQNIYYTNNQPTKQHGFKSPINGNHRPLLGGVTDRPSIVRQITLDLMAQERSAKNCLLWSLYNSPSKSYGTIPSIYIGDYESDFPRGVFRIQSGGKKYTRNNRKRNHKTYKKNIFKNSNLQKSKKQINKKTKKN